MCFQSRWVLWVLSNILLILLLYLLQLANSNQSQIYLKKSWEKQNFKWDHDLVKAWCYEEHETAVETFHPLNSQNLTLWAVREGDLIDVIDFMTSGAARHLRQIRHLRHHQTVLWLGQRGLGRLEIKLLFENISKFKSMLKAGCLRLVLIIPMWNTDCSVVDTWLVLAWIISNGYSIFGNTSNFDRPAQRWLWLQCVLWPPPPPYSVFSFKFGNFEF